MPVFLGKYEGCALNREEKFIRAIGSFLGQNYQNKELIVICDGCHTAFDILYEKYSKQINEGLIKPYLRKKQPVFSGNVREYGLKKATGKIICYLDSDDIMGQGHLSTIGSQFNIKKYDWVYYDDFLHKNRSELHLKIVNLEHGSIGTSSIAHKNIRKFLGIFGKQISWKRCNGYGHDWTFVNSLIKRFPEFKKIYGAKYFICHMPNTFDY